MVRRLVASSSCGDTRSSNGGSSMEDRENERKKRWSGSSRLGLFSEKMRREDGGSNETEPRNKRSVGEMNQLLMMELMIRTLGRRVCCCVVKYREKGRTTEVSQGGEEMVRV